MNLLTGGLSNSGNGSLLTFGLESTMGGAIAEYLEPDIVLMIRSFATPLLITAENIALPVEP